MRAVAIFMNNIILNNQNLLCSFLANKDSDEAFIFLEEFFHSYTYNIRNGFFVSALRNILLIYTQSGLTGNYQKRALQIFSECDPKNMKDFDIKFNPVQTNFELISNQLNKLSEINFIKDFFQFLFEFKDFLEDFILKQAEPELNLLKQLEIQNQVTKIIIDDPVENYFYNHPKIQKLSKSVSAYNEIDYSLYEKHLDAIYKSITFDMANAMTLKLYKLREDVKEEICEKAEVEIERVQHIKNEIKKVQNEIKQARNKLRKLKLEIKKATMKKLALQKQQTIHDFKLTQNNTIRQNKLRSMRQIICKLYSEQNAYLNPYTDKHPDLYLDLYARAHKNKYYIYKYILLNIKKHLKTREKIISILIYKAVIKFFIPEEVATTLGYG